MKHANHEGQLLADYLTLKEITKKELSTIMGISHPTLSYHLKRPLLSNKFKQQLTEAGIELFENPTCFDDLLLKQNIQLKERIETLTGVIELQKQFISHVTRHCKNGVCLNFILKKEIAN